MAFHEIRFPTAISLGATGGPERRTEVVTLGSGFEQRNQRWADSRRNYDAGYGVKTLDDLYEVLAFFEERRAKLHGFRWKDYADFKSCRPMRQPSELDQQIGTGTGSQATFQLQKTYGTAFNPYTRDIKKPVPGSVTVAVGGAIADANTWTLDATTGAVTFLPGHLPASGDAITAGFEFDVPVRFDTDSLTVNIEEFGIGNIPKIAIVELRI